MNTIPVRYQLVDRNLGFDLMRAIAAAPMAAGRWAGRGDKQAGDQAAVDAPRDVLGVVPMRGTIVIGEGEKDEAPMLANGERVGEGTGPECDIAVDPVDATTLLANGMPNAIAVIAAADRGSIYAVPAAAAGRDPRDGVGSMTRGGTTVEPGDRASDTVGDGYLAMIDALSARGWLDADLAGRARGGWRA